MKLVFWYHLVPSHHKVFDADRKLCAFEHVPVKTRPLTVPHTTTVILTPRTGRLRPTEVKGLEGEA